MNKFKKMATMEKMYNNFKLRVSWNPAGWYCGYVYLPEGKNTNGINMDDLIVHGGVTLSTETVVGFDCAHYGDMIPGQQEGRVWTVADVFNELTHLAEQIEALL